MGALAIGPGLGRGDKEGDLLALALASNLPLVLDADALTRIAEPGEFARLFEDRSGSKIEQARRAAEQSRSVIVYKGPDTIVAAPDGRAGVAAAASGWLATAGTGDVLTGVIAAMRAWGLDAYEAACAVIRLSQALSRLPLVKAWFGICNPPDRLSGGLLEDRSCLGRSNWRTPIASRRLTIRYQSGLDCCGR